MATPSVNDLRTIVDDADTDTDWNQGATNSTTYAENISITEAIDNTSSQIYVTKSPSLDLSSDQLVYVWSTNIADQGTWKPGTLTDTPHGLLLADTNNTIVLLNAGSDREVFKHQDTQTTFQCQLIDLDYIATKNTNGEAFATTGTIASFDETDVEFFGAYFTTLAKAFKGWNCGVDIIRVGGYSDYVEFYGGTSGDPITFADCAAVDRSTSADRALGIIREYTADTYGCQGRLGIGYTSATYFEKDGFTLVFEDRDVTDSAFGLRFNHATSATPYTTVILKNGTIGSAGPGVEIEDAGTERLDLTIEGVAFNNLKNTVTFPSSYGTGGSGSITSCAFNGCGQIDPGPATFQNNTISNTTTTTTGAVLLDATGTSSWSGLTFNYGGGATEAAIYIDPGVTTPASFTFTNHTFSGYGINGSNTAAVYNNSGGQVTITNSGSTGITYRNGTSATTIINDAITITYTGLVAGTEVRVYKVSDGSEEDGTESTAGTTFAATLQGSTAYDVVVIAKGYVPVRLENRTYSGNQNVAVNLQPDRNYDAGT